ncbi:hypothetical protein Bca4012_027684 [Brassica carinata]
MYRGSTPAPVTTSPYVSDLLAKEPNAKEEFQSLIQVPDVEVVEVLLEVIEVRNIPKGHKGKLSVVFSKLSLILFFFFFLIFQTHLIILLIFFYS